MVLHGREVYKKPGSPPSFTPKMGMDLEDPRSSFPQRTLLPISLPRIVHTSAV